MSTYCDTNIINSFVNKDNLRDNFRGTDTKIYPQIKGFRNLEAQKKLNQINKCIVDKKTLFDDVRGHQASIGSILTLIGLKKITIKEINGYQEGKKVYDQACGKVKPGSKFANKFCEKGRLKNNLRKNDLNDIKHFGSAIKEGVDEFATENKKDFLEVQEFSPVKIV